MTNFVPKSKFSTKQPSSMPSAPTLPTPNYEALQHCQALIKTIQKEIKAMGNWISFAKYMQLALYSPGLGYYNGGLRKFGGSGDFVTAPEISTLFGRTLATQTIQILKKTELANILEFGAGSGKLALDLLLEMEKRKSLPSNYLILEISADLRHRQQDLFQRQAPHLLSRLHWLEQLPTRFSGLILANEVLDAMPVHLVSWHNNLLFEQGVSIKNEAFCWEERPLHDGELFQAARRLSRLTTNTNPDNYYISEVSLAIPGFIRSLADILQHGLILLIDYGFGASEYYHPQRNQGTLMCHYRHHAHTDPFYLPGLQDITSHVDFSAVTNATTNTKLELLGYTTQAHFLINSGITEILAQSPIEPVQDYLPLSNQLQQLVSPAEMGELFKVIAFGRNINQPLIGFSNGDKSRLL